MTVPSSLANAIENHHAVLITVHNPEEGQDYGTAWIETLTPVDTPYFRHAMIDENLVFGNEFEVTEGQPYVIDTLPSDVVELVLEDFDDLLSAYRKRSERPATHPVFFNRK